MGRWAGPDGPTGDVVDDPEPDPEALARRMVLDLLARAPRSRAELAERLARRRVPDEVVVRVLDRFAEVGLVDDVAYAESFVTSRHATRALGRRALAAELVRKGVGREVAADAAAAVTPDDEERAARAFVAKRLPACAGLPSEVVRRRLVGALGRKGYPAALAFRVVAEAVGAWESSAQREPDDDP